MHVLTPADATSLSRDRRHRLGEAIWLALDELTRIDEADGAELAAPDAPSIDGNDDFEPAPFHVWHPVLIDEVGWEFEWTMPMLDVFIGGLDDEIWLETHDELPAEAPVDEPPFALGPLWMDYGNEIWATHGPYPEDLRVPQPELVDEDDACVIRTWDYEIAIGSRSIGIDVAGDLDRFGPENLDEQLVTLVQGMTGWTYRATDDEEPADRRRVKQALAAGAPIAALEVDASASARRFLAFLVELDVVRLRPETPTRRVARVLQHLLAQPALPAGEALLACPEVEEVFADDDTLAALAALW